VVVRKDGLVKIIELFIFFYFVIYEERDGWCRNYDIDHYGPERGYPLPEPAGLSD
jgi:hypothetical protein